MFNICTRRNSSYFSSACYPIVFFASTSSLSSSKRRTLSILINLTKLVDVEFFNKWKMFIIKF